MPKKALWLEFLHPEGLCGLCGNYGIVNTTGIVRSPAGIECGVRTYCICPNGRAYKRIAGREARKRAKANA